LFQENLTRKPFLAATGPNSLLDPVAARMETEICLPEVLENGKERFHGDGTQASSHRNENPSFQSRLSGTMPLRTLPV
jgi:hypothetical protein